MAERTLAVIGTAGRKDDAGKLGPQLYDAMYADLLAAIEDSGCRSLISGGAAVADHLAVRAFVDGHADRLRLVMPARFLGAAFEEGVGRFDPGRIANYYHEQFSRWYRGSSFGEIDAAIARGADVSVIPGFKQRNSVVAAECSSLRAYTFGADRPPLTDLPLEGGYKSALDAGLKDGGTADTWNKSKVESKTHVSLTWLSKNFDPAMVAQRIEPPRKAWDGAFTPV